MYNQCFVVKIQRDYMEGGNTQQGTQIEDPICLEDPIEILSSSSSSDSSSDSSDSESETETEAQANYNQIRARFRSTSSLSIESSTTDLGEIRRSFSFVPRINPDKDTFFQGRHFKPPLPEGDQKNPFGLRGNYFLDVEEKSPRKDSSFSSSTVTSASSLFSSPAFGAFKKQKTDGPQCPDLVMSMSPLVLPEVTKNFTTVQNRFFLL